LEIGEGFGGGEDGRGVGRFVLAGDAAGDKEEEERDSCHSDMVLKRLECWSACGQNPQDSTREAEPLRERTNMRFFSVVNQQLR